MELQERIERALEELGRFGAGPEGVTRLPFTPAAEKSVQWLKAYMEAAGLAVTVDPTGAVVGHLQGKQKKAVLTGSHYDSVIGGGAYDGTAGIICAVEAVRLMQERGVRPEYSLDVIATNDEEGVRFSKGFLTSTSMCRGWTEEDLEEICDLDTGKSLADVMRENGYPPEAVPERRGSAGRYRKFIEVHIEQGPVLDEAEIPLGVVTSIAGISRYFFTVRGTANHAGSTPMGRRQDALAAAAEMICFITREASSRTGITATVGHLEVTPNAVNVVPGEVVFSLDMRSEGEEKRKELYEKILAYAEETARRSKTFLSVRQTVDAPTVYMEKKLQERFCRCAEKEGIPYLVFPSGAGHDAQIYGEEIPVGMLFVRSRGGISHNRLEYTDGADLARAVRVLSLVLEEELTDHDQKESE